MFSLFENVGAELAARMSRQDGIGLDEMEEMAESGDVGPEGRDILMEERELRRKADMDLQKKLQLVSEGKYKSPAPLNDGDQTPVKGHALRILKTQWSGGMDYNPQNPHLSDWMKSLYYGNYSAVLEKINQTSQENLTNLLEKRESLLNVSSIFHVVIGARTLCGDHADFKDLNYTKKNNQEDHLSCFFKLLELGVRVDAKDVAGHTPLHHCLTIYANDVTRKMAKILLKRGVDPNIQNRFGATALMEPTMHMKLDSIQLLLKYGADPNIADSDGITCYKVAKHYPKVMALFSKAVRSMAKAKRKELKEEAGGSLRACSVCAEEKDTMRCMGCYLVWYCGPDCQRIVWNEHKELCKETKKKFVPVKLKTEMTDAAVVMSKSFVSGKVSVGKNGVAPRKKNFMVKVQVPLSAQGTLVVVKQDPLYVYNQDRSCQGYLFQEGNEEVYRLLKEKVEEEGFKGIKGFFYATWDDNRGLLKINATDIQVVETW